VNALSLATVYISHILETKVKRHEDFAGMFCCDISFFSSLPSGSIISVVSETDTRKQGCTFDDIDDIVILFQNVFNGSLLCIKQNNDMTALLYFVSRMKIDWSMIPIPLNSFVVSAPLKVYTLQIFGDICTNSIFAIARFSNPAVQSTGSTKKRPFGCPYFSSL
jgi:hypothetical protein